MAEIILLALPEPSVMCDCGGDYYTAATVRSLLEQTAREVLEQAARVADDMPIQYERDGHYFRTMPEDFGVAIRGIQVKEGE